MCFRVLQQTLEPIHIPYLLVLKATKVKIKLDLM